MLVDHQPDLLDDNNRKAAIEFIIRRTCWSLSPSSCHHVVPLLERLISNENCKLITHLSISSTVEPTTTTSSNIHRTQVAIIGTEPAGSVLGALLSQSGIDSIVLERHSRSYVESNIRAGLLEQATVDVLDDIGVAGCDGVLSPCCRRSVPPNILHTIERVYPFAWLSLLVEAPPSTKELIYSANTIYGFALQSIRPPRSTRFHLQVSLNDTLADWPDERIWN
ncbi:unnamed protein product, partial [Rotaria sordida]